MKFRDPYKVQTITAPNEIYLAFFKVTENSYLPKNSMSRKSATKASRGIPCDPYLFSTFFLIEASIVLRQLLCKKSGITLIYEG